MLHVIPYKPRSVFRSFHKRKNRWACIVAHRRCGKTVACINDVIKAALIENKSDGRYAYVCPLLSQAKAVAWDYLLRFTDGIRIASNATELSVTLPHGARIRLYGADLPDSLRGQYFDGVIMDEYADMRPRVWGEVIRPLLADRKGWAVFIGTPKGHNSFYDIWRTARTDPEWMCLTLRASETRILDDVELRDAAKGMTEDQYAQEFECSFEAAITGAIFGREMADAEKQGRVCAVPWDDAARVFTAWDIGYRDDTAIWFYQVVREEIHLVDFHASSGADIDFYANVITSKPYAYAKHWLPHDARAKTLASGGKSVVEQLASHLGIGKLDIVPNLGLQSGIQAARLCLPRCYFDAEKTGDGVEALKQYQREWDDDKKAFREQPRHDWTSHPSDAFRMMAVAWRRNEKPEPPPEAPRALMVGPGNRATLNDLWNAVVKTRPRI